MTLSAVTYVWKGPKSRLSSQWDINRFVRSKSFNRLSFRYKGGDVYSEKERKLASSMGTTYVLAGTCCAVRFCKAIRTKCWSIWTMATMSMHRAQLMGALYKLRH